MQGQDIYGTKDHSLEEVEDDHVSFKSDVKIVLRCPPATKEKDGTDVTRTDVIISGK